VKPREHTVCGLVAVKALFARDAGAIKRLYFDYETGRRIGVICRALAAARKIYRCVEPLELEKVAGTVHHGGIVAVIEPRVLRAPRREDVRPGRRRARRCWSSTASPTPTTSAPSCAPRRSLASSRS
jgi:TrmH RNA methyltransferase